MKYKLRGKVWLYPGPPDGGGSWHFVNVSREISKEIKENFAEVGRGFGSLRVKVTVGKTRWNTSIFPDTKSGTYLLPLKAEVRQKEVISDGTKISFTIEIQP